MVPMILEQFRHVKDQFPWVLGFFVLFGLLPVIHFNYLDGNIYNRVLTFNDGVDPLALVTTQEEYCPGDSVYVYNNFTKNRHVEVISTFWWISNGSISLAPRDLTLTGGQLPLGTYPRSGVGRISTYIHDIPYDAIPGLHLSLGLSKHRLESGQERAQEYKTLPYFVLPPEQCS